MAARTIIAGVTVVDVRTGGLLPDSELVISDGLITAVARAGTTPRTDHDDVLTPGPVFVVPGFTDTHAHALNLTEPDGTLALMLAFGITSFRQMSGSSDLLRRRARDQLGLPADSPALTALCGEILSPANAATPMEARETVRSEAADGADFIKVAAVSPDTLTAVQREAAAWGVPVAGHLPAGADPRAAARLGFTIEHLGPGIPLLAACSTDEQAIQAQLRSGSELRLPRLPRPVLARILTMALPRVVVNPTARATDSSIALLQHALDTFDDGKARELAQLFVREDTWVTPTLVRQLTSQRADIPSFRDDPDLRYVKPGTVRFWTRSADHFSKKYTPQQHATFAAQHDTELRLVKIFAEEGVRMTTGSDATGAGWVIAGPSLHREFDLLAAAGVDPLRILQMTTVDAASLVGRSEDSGTIEVGKLADLVFLARDPRESAAHLHDIVGVVRQGRHYAPSDLSALREGVAAARSVT
ncbi:amidohydrolase family protein [Leifsonia sp. ZF2019]|uniref:amidohydrolase family protein n=1 Tax=Leifsonia sp. ZF2019 TaxID=2781978 RepID=UPI001CBE94F2|nr:amidohydrolase family protein [Leifsonia sp. ZF2019]UAJ79506.1 amidohydrolase family protein [Leifsonia sp. ZF2019]